MQAVKIPRFYELKLRKSRLCKCGKSEVESAFNINLFIKTFPYI